MNKRSYLVHILQALGPLILVAITAATHLDFVATAIAGNPFLNIAIIVVASSGSVLFILRLVDANRERVAVLRYAEEVAAGTNMKELTSADWLEGRSVARFLDYIAQTGGKLASQLDQNAIESELDALDHEFNSKMELPSFLVGFMVAMGLLGTFIGLLETLTGISGMLDGLANGPATGSIDTEFLKLVGELRKPLSGMGIAFSASMFGLVGSLVLGLIQLAVRRYNAVVMGDARDVLHRLTERIRSAGGPLSVGPAAARGGVSEAFLSDFMAELISNMNQMQELFHRSQDSALAVSSRVDTMSRKLEDVATSIDGSVEASKRTNDLLGFGPRMKETNEAMLSEIRSLLTNGQDRQKVMVRLVDTLNSIDQKMSTTTDSNRSHYDLVGNLNTQSLAKLDEAVGLLQSVSDRASDSETKMDRRLQALGTSTTNIANSMQQLAAKLGEVATVGQSQLSAQGQAQQMLRDASSDVQGLLTGLQDKMQKMQEVEIGGTRHLYDIKESFNNLGTSLESLKGMSQGVSRQTSLLEATLEELRNSQRNLARELRKEFREMARDDSRETAQ